MRAPMDNVYGWEQQMHISLRGFKNKQEGDIRRYMIKQVCDKESETQRGVKRQREQDCITKVKRQIKLTDMFPQHTDVIMRHPIVLRNSLEPIDIDISFDKNVTKNLFNTDIHFRNFEQNKNKKDTDTSTSTPKNVTEILQQAYQTNVNEYVAYILYEKTKDENLGCLIKRLTVCEINNLTCVCLK